jgi:drug/metabolite transporter (DMT)-like permease
MTWFLVSLLCAAAESAKDALSKVAGRQSDALTLALAGILFPLPFFYFALAWNGAIPQADGTFLIALIGHSLIFAFSLWLYMEAVRIAPLSLTVPLICFTPAFFLLTSPLMTGETFSSLGILATALIALGAYALFFDRRNNDLLGPLKAVVRDRGARNMLLVAFLWSVSGNFDRLGILHSNAVFWGACDLSLIALILFTARWLQGGGSPLFTRFHARMAFCNGLSILFYYWGATIQKVAYVVTVKRCSVLFGVVIGYFLFGEQNIRQRLFGACLMFLGVLCIAFAR